MTEHRIWTPPESPSTQQFAVVTPRQSDVLTGMALGLTNLQIGNRLGLSDQTVKSHAKRLFASMGARDRCHAVSLAMSGQVTVVVEVGS